MFETRPHDSHMSFELNMMFNGLLAFVFVLNDLFEFRDGILLRRVDCNDPYFYPGVLWLFVHFCGPNYFWYIIFLNVRK